MELHSGGGSSDMEEGAAGHETPAAGPALLAAAGSSKEEDSSDEVESPPTPPGRATKAMKPAARPPRAPKSRFSLLRGPTRTDKRTSQSGSKKRKKKEKKAVWIKIDPVPFAPYSGTNNTANAAGLRPQGYAIRSPQGFGSRVGAESAEFDYEVGAAESPSVVSADGR